MFFEDKQDENENGVRKKVAKSVFFFFFLSSLFNALFFLLFRQNKGRYFAVTSNERSSVH
jgi:hypothetical protein